MTLPPPPPSAKKPPPRTSPAAKREEAKRREPLPKGPQILPPSGQLPPAPEGEPAPTKPQFKDKMGPQIMGPAEPDAVEAAAKELGVYSNTEFAEMQWIKESMWQYENRPRGRSAQGSLGPSEIGSACERKLVYRLTGTKPFTHGSGPNWPAIVGTSIHSWMEQMLQWLDQDRGRYLIEHRVEIIEGEVSGTLDVYDRLQKRVRDWKFPGARAVRKYRLEGVGSQYRTQGQIYAYGLARQGETPKDISVAMIARDASSVDQGIHCEIFPYVPSEARAAVEKYNRLKALSLTVASPLDVPATPSSLCAYCSFYAPGVKGACAGR